MPLTEKEAAKILVTEILTHEKSKMEQAALADFMSKQPRGTVADILRMSARDFRARCLNWIEAFKGGRAANTG